MFDCFRVSVTATITATAFNFYSTGQTFLIGSQFGHFC